ncbi:MAG TPA: GNAT family N-acetyltransferase [Telluria sp.]
MEKSLVIRTLRPDEWTSYRDIRLRALADAADAFGSTLAEEQERAPDAWAARLAVAATSGEDYPLIAELAGTVVGLLWAKVDAADPSAVNIFQVWVAPESRGRGVADALLREAISWARSRQSRVVQLGVTCGDTAAGRLYLRAGFRNVGAPVPRRPGSPLLEQSMHLVIDAGAA